MIKTNVMRLLDLAKIPYKAREYDSNFTDGQTVARLLGEDENFVFKTLVTVSNTLEHFVFVVPVNCSLNLKKAASVAKVKSIEMIKHQDFIDDPKNIYEKIKEN